MLRRIQWRYWGMLSDIINRRLSASLSDQDRLTAEFRGQIRQLVHYQQAAADSEPVWTEHERALIEHVLNDNPRRFLHWPVVRYTMFVTDSAYIPVELAALRAQPEFETRWLPALREVAAGWPRRSRYFPASSGNAIHHAYHLLMFEQTTSTRVEDLDVIFEFGAGYGSMCRVAHALGFRGTYVLFDLPAFSALQRYYLRLLQFNVVSPETIEPGAPGVVCLDDAAQAQAILARGAGSKSLLLATWSLSETPLAFREQMKPLTKSFSAYLLAFQQTFQGVDNLQYFEQWQHDRPGVTWRDWAIEHLPASRYLIGWHKDER
ncbi:MAG: hypothetical protein JW966_12065 [Anaerolineae bacterium]|nr:hypothetical protein [Anaerolineae bacterium]